MGKSWIDPQNKRTCSFSPKTHWLLAIQQYNHYWSAESAPQRRWPPFRENYQDLTEHHFRWPRLLKNLVKEKVALYAVFIAIVELRTIQYQIYKGTEGGWECANQHSNGSKCRLIWDIKQKVIFFPQDTRLLQSVCLSGKSSYVLIELSCPFVFHLLHYMCTAVWSALSLRSWI